MRSTGKRRAPEYLALGSLAKTLVHRFIDLVPALDPVVGRDRRGIPYLNGRIPGPRFDALRHSGGGVFNCVTLLSVTMVGMLHSAIRSNGALGQNCPYLLSAILRHKC